MDSLPRVPMLAAEFIEWSLRQPEGKHYELVDGLIVESLSERVAYMRVKMRVARALDDAINAAGLQCEMFGDGMAVRVTDNTVFEPDAAVQCGPPLDGDATIYDDPVIVVEVVSPSSSGHDRGAKLDGYFHIPALMHYLIVLIDKKRVIHHSRDGDRISTRTFNSGQLVLNPPGLTLDVPSLFPAS
jgi:Uma2 family endonuclease